MDKRYQVFLSSTYADLKEERRAVMQALMEMDCIPAGMELFPAADEEQFEFIKKVINDCDYYLIIVGGRYGSITADGISYTEKEYEYAKERGIRIIAFLHENPDDIPVKKSELDPVLRVRLHDFRNKLSTGRLVKYWTSAEQLPGLVALSLQKTIKTYPSVGWVRANSVATEAHLVELNDLRKQNSELQSRIAQFTQQHLPAVENLASLDEIFDLKFRFRHIEYGMLDGNINLSWRKIISLIAPHLLAPLNETLFKNIIEKALLEQYSLSSITDYDYQTIKIQLVAINVVTIRYAETTKKSMALFVELTPYGRKLLIEERTVKGNNQSVLS